MTASNSAGGTNSDTVTLTVQTNLNVIYNPFSITRRVAAGPPSASWPTAPCRLPISGIASPMRWIEQSPVPPATRCGYRTFNPLPVELTIMLRLPVLWQPAQRPGKPDCDCADERGAYERLFQGRHGRQPGRLLAFGRKQVAPRHWIPRAASTAHIHTSEAI